MTEIHKRSDLKIIKTRLSDVNEHAEEESDIRSLML